MSEESNSDQKVSHSEQSLTVPDSEKTDEIYDPALELDAYAVRIFQLEMANTEKVLSDQAIAKLTGFARATVSSRRKSVPYQRAKAQIFKTALTILAILSRSVRSESRMYL